MVNFGKSLGIGSLAAILQRDGASLTVRFERVNVDVVALSSNHRHAIPVWTHQMDELSSFADAP